MSGRIPAANGGTVVTVGSFDGVHLGHQAILGEVVERAARRGVPGMLVTFEPHPAAVLGRGGAPARLTTESERAEIVAELGLERLLVVRFDRELAEKSAEAFVREILLGRCGMLELVLGADHGFGKDRRGDSRTLPALGERLGFGVCVVAPVTDARGEAIKSTRIRAAIAEGDLARAAGWLGRPYRLTAGVIRGAGRGRTIGVPTINLDGPTPGKALPPDGVYAARVEWGGGTAGAMLNQGPRPTVDDARRSLEAHLFGVEEELEGRTVRLEWVERLRDIRRFPSLAHLKEQLAQDREHALAILAGRPETSTARPTGAR